MSHSHQPRGQRIKRWGLDENPRALVEGTGEYPIMYRALGTEPQSAHPFNLYADISSQADALRETFEHADEIEAAAEALAARDLSAGVLGIGSGTSQFVGQVANIALGSFAGVPSWDVDSLAYLQDHKPYDFARMAVMAYSGSGSTVDTVAATRHAKEHGAYTVGFTSVDSSPVAELVHSKILTAGGFDTGGSDTFHYTTRTAASVLLAVELGARRNPGAHDFDALRAGLLSTPKLFQEMFATVDARCRTIARQFHDVRAILVVGAGANYGTAEEMALKFDEMAHIPAKPMVPGRHIHGALGLTDERILTVIIAPAGGNSQDELTAIARATQMLKSPSVAVVSEGDSEISELVDYVVRLPDIDATSFAVLAALPAQLIPYYSGVELGFNPDTQRSNVPKHARVWNMFFPPGTH
ncbi:MAG TPA: SIS domain-containing protein [Streptosporangiaceae bacterium]|nr:SIS domain-containing protein [Streptosporangiaceae bacterium]